MIWSIFDVACQQGFFYAIAVFGVVISFRVVNYPDLTVDGSFTLGGALAATLIVRHYPPVVATVIATVAGFMAGLCTVFLNRKLGISKVLSGILVMIMLYSVNLRIMGRANVSLLRERTLFSFLDDWAPGNVGRLLVLAVICGTVFFALCYFFTSRVGLFIRAAGDNEFMVQSQGINTNWIQFLSIGVANALVAFCGSLIAQFQGFADVNMGVGLIITALAGLIIGESFNALLGWLCIDRFMHALKRISHVNSRLPFGMYNLFIAAIIGSLIYFAIISVCLRIGLEPTDLRLATGILVILGISLRFKGPMVETHLRGKL